MMIFYWMDKMTKKSFVLHIDSLSVLDEMTDEQAGVFFKSLYYYQKNLQLPEMDLITKIAIKPFINQFIRDAEKWANVAERNKANGFKGGRPKTKRNPDNPVGFLETQNNPEKPRKAVSVSVSVNDSVNVNVNENNKPIGFNFDGFDDKEIESIKLFLQYKKEKKSSYKDTGLIMLRNELLKLKKEHNLVDCINSSMANNYQGVFPPKQDSRYKKTQATIDALHRCNSQDFSGEF
jgi:hypothetical protein